MEYTASFQKYLGFHSKYLPENSYAALSTHGLQMFVANRPIIKRTLLEEQCVFSAVFLIPLNGIS
jgi:hypothetical protein